MGQSFAAIGVKPSAAPADTNANSDKPRPRETSGAEPDASGPSVAGEKHRETRAAPARPAASTRDPQMIAFIERELSDTSPAERAALQKTLRDLPDESVRHILNERRKGLRLVSQQPVDGGSRRSPAPLAAVQPVEARIMPGDDGSTAPPRPHSPNGLGTLSAWGQPTTTRRSIPMPLDAAAPTNEPAPTAVRTADGRNEAGEMRSPAVRQSVSDTAASVGHSSGFRSPPPAENSAAAPARTTSQPVPAAAAAKGNPILGYLIPGRFRSGPAATPKTGTGPTIVSQPTASVALGAPGEVAATGSSTDDGSDARRAKADELLDALIAAAEAEVAPLPAGSDDIQKRTYVEQQVYLRMLYLMSGRQERALQAIPGIDPADQEFWQQTFWGLANYFDANSMPLPADRASQTVSQLTKAVFRLQEKAHLELRNVNLCHKIALFGSYDKYPRDEFRPGQEVLLYAEMANIHSEPTADGKYRTNLKSTLEIHRHGTEGELVDRIEFPEQVDLCRSHRHDYFNSYKYTMPAQLTLGPHVLKLTVEDQLSRRTATYSLNFMVK
jgi:hypothetical protein